MLLSSDINQKLAWNRFIFLCVLIVTLTWAFQYLLISDVLYFNYFSERLNDEHIETLIEQGTKWNLIGYGLLPLLYFFKLSIISISLGLGLFFVNNRFKFKAFFNVVVFAESIFLLPILTKLLWFLFIQTKYDLNDLNQFYPLSVLNLIDIEAISKYWIYPLQTLK